MDKVRELYIPLNISIHVYARNLKEKWYTNDKIINFRIFWMKTEFNWKICMIVNIKRHYHMCSNENLEIYKGVF